MDAEERAEIEEAIENIASVNIQDLSLVLRRIKHDGLPERWEVTELIRQIWEESE